LWNEHKEYIQIYLNQHNNAKDYEIEILKESIKSLDNEIDNFKNLHESLLKESMLSIDDQLKQFKERELFTVGQLLEMENKFKVLKADKERTINLMKEEIQQIKNHNLILSKVHNK
jgi:hypothetical protein